MPPSHRTPRPVRSRWSRPAARRSRPVTVFYDILFLSEQLGLASPLPALRHRLSAVARALGANALRLGRRLIA
ncbi:MAG: hypothetical protein ACRDYF_08330 [Acidimicrobiia bacterium]